MYDTLSFYLPGWAAGTLGGSFLIWEWAGDTLCGCVMTELVAHFWFSSQEWRAFYHFGLIWLSLSFLPGVGLVLTSFSYQGPVQVTLQQEVDMCFDNVQCSCNVVGKGRLQQKNQNLIGIFQLGWVGWSPRVHFPIKK